MPIAYPLLYQQSACATFKSVLDTTWRNYGVPQSRGALPAGPMVIFVHMASVWVPFTSESKEAIADYDEIRKEMKLALQECGRRLGVFLRRRERAKSEFPPAQYFRTLYRRSRRSVQPPQRWKTAQGKTQRAAAKDRHETRPAAKKPTSYWDTTAVARESLPHSIIVTAEGTEGDAPELTGDEGNDGAPSEELPLDLDTSAAPARPKGKSVSSKSTKPNKSKMTGKKNPVKVQPPQSAKQMTLGFDTAGTDAKRSQRIGKKHGAKKVKK